MQIQKVIEQLGFSAKDAKVYLAALELGEAHISDIAQKANMLRSSAQVIVDKLRAEGLMNFYVMHRYKYWIAEHPERLLHNLKKKEGMLAEALPSLVAMRKAGQGKQRTQKDREVDLGVFRIIADAARQPILITNEAAEIIYVNEVWENQFGYTLEEVRGENPRILQSGKTPPEIYAHMWRELTLGKMFQSDEVIDTKKDGTHFNLLTTIFSVKHNGRLFYIQILDDITERKRVEALQEQFKKVGV